jgi:hypothetical protein
MAMDWSYCEEREGSIENKHWIETARSQKEIKTEANLEKDLFGRSRKMRQNME